MKKVAFICVHNSCRSQIAEALCKLYRKDLEAYSAGTEIKKVINEAAKRIMQEKYHISMDKQYPKLISEIPVCDIYVSMGCNVSCPTVLGGFTYDFGLADPTGKSDEEYIKVIEEIKEKIMKL